MAIRIDKLSQRSLNLVPLENELKRFDVPQWKFEGCTSEKEYKEKFVALVNSLKTQSERKYNPIKERWANNEKRVELEQSGRGAINSISRSDLALVPQAVEESVALAVEQLPRPSAAPKQASQEQFAGALNYFMTEECDANDFDLVVARAMFDSKLFSVGFIKQTVDMEQTGPLGQPGRIIFKNVDPRHVYPDPYAKSWRWEDMRYLVVVEPQDLSDIRARFPGASLEVAPEDDCSIKSEEGATLGWEPSIGDDYVVGARHRARVIECWLKDDRKVWHPMTDPKTDEEYVDEDGRPLGTFKKKYPGGRLLIVANGVLLADTHNPFRHKQPPYTAFQSRISRKLFGYGDVELIGMIEDKINQLHKDALRNLRVAMNTPWVVDHNAFDAAEKFHMLTNDPGMVLPVTPGARVERLVAGELPVSLFNFVNWMKSQFDDMLGVQPVLRGQLEKGSQLSAEAVENLQVSSTSRIRLKSRLMENALKHLGQLLQWNIRQFYPSEFAVEMRDPRSGEQIKVSWSANAAESDYAISIEAGSSLPGSKGAKQESFRQLYKDGLIDREYAIQGMELPGADTLIKRMNDREEALAKLGLLAKLTRPKNKQRRAA